VLTQMQVAERELALYAAIIGHRPTVDAESPKQEQHSETDPPAPIPLHSFHHNFHLDSAELKHRVAGWVKEMSHQAKRRIDEAKMRLAG
jgi:hypothetical protein